MPSEYAPLLREPLTIRVAGTAITIPYRPVALWVKALGEQARLPLAAALADAPAREVLADLLMEHPQAAADLRAESLRILGETSGRKWWEAGRLLNTSVAPEILGRMVLAGVDPWNRSVGEWCAAVYALCVKGQDEKGRLRFDFSLQLPPPEFEDEWDDDGDPAEAQAFLASIKKR